jgi:PadR family transcriptional regulator AphA
MFDRFGGQPQADHNYSRLTALCGAYHYSAMRDWALEAKQILSKKEAGLP